MYPWGPRRLNEIKTCHLVFFFSLFACLRQDLNTWLSTLDPPVSVSWVLVLQLWTSGLCGMSIIIFLYSVTFRFTNTHYHDIVQNSPCGTGWLLRRSQQFHIPWACSRFDCEDYLLILCGVLITIKLPHHTYISSDVPAFRWYISAVGPSHLSLP